MSSTRDFDDIARAWLDLMPDEAPERVIADVLNAVAKAPQVRSPWRWRPWRSSPMNRLPVVLAAAVVVAVAGALLVSRSGTPPTVGSSPSPAPSTGSTASSVPPSGSPAASGSSPLAGAAVPEALRHRWMGGTNSLVQTGAGSTLVIGAEGFAVAEATSGNAPVLTASAAATADDQIRLSTAGLSARCDVGQAGTYTWSLSPSGRVLSFYAADDACATRDNAVRGTWWLMGCKDATDNCLGDLDAATYQSQSVNFAHPGGASWAPEFGALTYRVPDGWANDADWPNRFDLTTQSAYAQATPQTGTTEGIAIDADAHAEDQVRACSGVPTTAEQAPNAFLAYLRGSAPGLVVGTSTAITVDGRAGWYADLSLKDADVRPCDSDRVVEYLVTGNGPQRDYEAVVPGHRSRLILLPGSSGLVAIVIDAEAARFDAVVAESMPIVASLHFH